MRRDAPSLAFPPYGPMVFIRCRDGPGVWMMGFGAVEITDIPKVHRRASIHPTVLPQSLQVISKSPSVI